MTTTAWTTQSDAGCQLRIRVFSTFPLMQDFFKTLERSMNYRMPYTHKLVRLHFFSSIGTAYTCFPVCPTRFRENGRRAGFPSESTLHRIAFNRFAFLFYCRNVGQTPTIASDALCQVWVQKKLHALHIVESKMEFKNVVG